MAIETIKSQESEQLILQERELRELRESILRLRSEFNSNINGVVWFKRRSYHLREEPRTKMRKKEILFLPEWIEYLKAKFWNHADVLFVDVKWMGASNEILWKDAVDHCFRLMSDAIDETYWTSPNLDKWERAKALEERPVEVIRFWWDEIVFIVRAWDTKIQRFIELYERKKTEYLKSLWEIEYVRVKHETNIKTQMKQMTTENWWVSASELGDKFAVKNAILEWLNQLLSWYHRDPSRKRLDDLMRALASKRVEECLPSELVEPLSFYVSNMNCVDFDGIKARNNMLTAIALCDSEISNNKKSKNSDRKAGHDESKISMATDNYLLQALQLELTTLKKERLDLEMFKALRAGSNEADIQAINSKLIKLEAEDPWTWALRYEEIERKMLLDYINIPEWTTGFEVVKVDVSFFGVFNNHYDYATSDMMMKRVYSVLDNYLHDLWLIIREWWCFYVMKAVNWAWELNLQNAQAELNSIVREYANHKDPKVKRAMESEVMVKSATGRNQGVFGSVELDRVNFISISDMQARSAWEVLSKFYK